MQYSILPLYAVAILLGCLTGLIASGFQLAIQQLDLFIAYVLARASVHSLVLLLLSMLISSLLLILARFLVVRFAPEAAGSGIQEIEGALLHVRPMYWRRLLPVKFIGGVLAISSHLLVGREGPTIQMGGNLGQILGERFGLHRKHQDTLIAAGAAAGLAAAFNAPLAGVLFILEEMRSQFSFSFTNFKMVAIACVMATITLDLILGNAPAIPMMVFQLPNLSALWWFFIFGLIAGLVAWAFNTLLIKGLYLIDNISLRLYQFYVLIFGLIIGALAYVHPQIVGGGYDLIHQALNIRLPLYLLFFLFILRFVMTPLSYIIGVPGGIFAPLLALGTLLGLSFAGFFSGIGQNLSIHPGMFAVAGMGALFSASVRAPITGIVLVVEMTQNYSLILPLMVSCLTSTTVMQLVNNVPIYTQLLEKTLQHKKKKTAA